MVPFCGWRMAVNYKPGVKEEIKIVRNECGIYDVSHMGQLVITGKDKERFMEYVTPVDLGSMKVDQIKYSMFLNKCGGVIDDTMICKHADHLYVVVNAACYDKDLAYLNKIASNFGDVKIQNLYKTHALVAIQGPKAEEIMERIVPKSSAAKLKAQKFMTRIPMEIAGVECVMARSGYTGEDGFEISIPSSKVERVVEAMLRNGAKCCGLGSRDTLRLEAGLSLYGQDLDDFTTPVEADLTWCISKRRKANGGFIGADVIQKQLAEGTIKKRVGLIIDGPPARDGCYVHLPSGEVVGKITSGGPSPTSGKNIAIASILNYGDCNFKGKDLKVSVRGKLHNARLAKMPFVPHNYRS